VPSAQTVFRAVDSMDPAAFVRLLAEDARMRFGNADPLVGHEAITAGATAFFGAIQKLRHAISTVWTVGADTIAETDVTYTRHDGKEVTIPVVSIWRVGVDDRIVDYRVFFDVAPVFAPG
jgi:ketosteroid isomerase-like protein